jgi:GDPmannose 4,6-dehydratase
MEKKVKLGNLDARRDWGYAKDYVVAMWLMLQQDTPDDYVVGTGKNHSVRDFAELAFSYAGLDYRDHVETDSALFRPAEVFTLTGDTSKARARLAWNYHCTFEDLVAKMVQSDLDFFKKKKG